MRRTQLETGEVIKLSPKEQQVVALACAGHANKEIAWRLGISEGTTKVYLSRVYEALEISSRYSLMVLAAEHPQILSSGEYHRPRGGTAVPEQPVFFYLTRAEFTYALRVAGRAGKRLSVFCREAVLDVADRIDAELTVAAMQPPHGEE